MVCLPTLFEKGKNAPPISKPCLLVISRNRNKAFQGLKNPTNLLNSKIAKSGMVGGCRNWWKEMRKKSNKIWRLKIKWFENNLHENILKRYNFESFDPFCIFRAIMPSRKVTADFSNWCNKPNLLFSWNFCLLIKIKPKFNL